MEFMKHLIETNESQILRNSPDLYSPIHPFEDYGFRMFEPIRLTDQLMLSVQGSHVHYCTPRKTLPADQYEDFEVAIFKDGEFTMIEEVTNDPELLSAFEDEGMGHVYPNVEPKYIEKLFLSLREEPVTEGGTR